MLLFFGSCCGAKPSKAKTTRTIKAVYIETKLKKKIINKNNLKLKPRNPEVIPTNASTADCPVYSCLPNVGKALEI